LNTYNTGGSKKSRTNGNAKVNEDENSDNMAKKDGNQGNFLWSQ
jgi:hypothetical protein